MFVEDNFSCSHNINYVEGLAAEDICEDRIKEDTVEITCSISYRGNKPPPIFWSSDPPWDDPDKFSIVNTINGTMAVSKYSSKAHMLVNISVIKLTSLIGTQFEFGYQSIVKGLNWTSPQLKFFGKFVSRHR